MPVCSSSCGDTVMPYACVSNILSLFTASVPSISRAGSLSANPSICACSSASSKLFLSSNILTKIFEERKSFEDALLQAQIEGFAESDPALDIEGTDAVNKLSILLTHAYGITVSPQELLHTGIHNLHGKDAVFAKEKGYEIKLVAQAHKLQ